MLPNRAHEPQAGRGALLSGPLTPFLLALLVFANTLGNGFTYDDNPIIVENPRVRDLSDVRGIWLTDWWASRLDDEQALSPKRDRLYRPLTLFTFALNFAAGGLRPFGYHLVNVLLHAAVSGLVWELAWRWTRRRAVALLAAALFAVHPLHVEAVAGVVGRAEVLAALFLLLGLVPLLGARVGSATLAGVASAFFAALLSKETAICYPGLVALLCGWVRPRLQLPRLGPARLAALLIPLLIYFPLRWTALQGQLLRDAPGNTLFNPLVDADAWGRMHGALAVLGHYTRLLFAPSALSCDYGLAVIDPFAGAGWMSGVGLLAALGLAIGMFGLTKPQGVWRSAGEALAAVGVSYVLISNTVLLIGVSVAERLFYWPSAPALLAIAILLHGLAARALAGGWPSRLAAVAACTLLAGRAAGRNFDWRDDERLFSADTRTYPQAAHLNNSLAQILLFDAQRAADGEEKRRLLVRAATLLDRALSVHSRYPHALYQRGLVYALSGEPQRGLTFLERSLALGPSSLRTQALIRELRGEQGSQSQAIEALRAATASSPATAEARTALGYALLQSGDALQALAEFDQAGGHGQAQRGRGQALALLARDEEAIRAFRIAVAVDPQDWESHANLATLLSRRDPQAALTHARRAADLQPNDLRTQVNLAEALALNGRTIEALERFRRVQRSLSSEDPFSRAIADRIRELERP